MLKEKETTTVSIRIDKDLKAKSERPNATTLKAMEEASRISRDTSAKTYASFEDVVKELDD